MAGKDESDTWISGADIQGGLIGQRMVVRTPLKPTIVNSLAATVMDGRNGKIAKLGGTGRRSDGRDCAVTKCCADSYLTGDVTGGLVAHVNSSKM